MTNLVLESIVVGCERLSDPFQSKLLVPATAMLRTALVRRFVFLDPGAQIFIVWNNRGNPPDARNETRLPIDNLNENPLYPYCPIRPPDCDPVCPTWLDNLSE